MRRPRFHRPYTTRELLVWRRAFIDDAGCQPTTESLYMAWRRWCWTAPDPGTLRQHFGSWAAFLSHPVP